MIDSSLSRFKFLVLAFLLVFSKLVNCFAQDGEKTVKTLIDMGFENVSVIEEDSVRVYFLQNDVYRLVGTGIGKAVDVVQSIGLPKDKDCKIIVLDNNVPQFSLVYSRIEADSLSNISRSDWQLSYDVGDSWNQFRKIKKENSSLYKVDVLVYPELSYKNVIITQIYQVLFNLSPAVEVSLWNGMKFVAQMVVPIYNDGYGSRSSKVRPRYIMAEQSVRLPYQTWATLSVGLFSNQRYGVDLSAKHVFKDEHFTIDGRLGYTKTYIWDGFKFLYGTESVWTWNLSGSYYWTRYNLESRLKVEKHILGEKSVRVDFIRHFRHASIGFYAMKAKDIDSEGGFLFQIALPPYKNKRKGYIPRVTSSDQFGLEYWATWMRYGEYGTYQTRPGQNVMSRNSFNPYYIKSEMLNY